LKDGLTEDLIEQKMDKFEHLNGFNLRLGNIISFKVTPRRMVGVIMLLGQLKLRKLNGESTLTMLKKSKW